MWQKDLPHLISRQQFNAYCKLTAQFTKEIRKNVDVAINGFDTVHYIVSTL